MAMTNTLSDYGRKMKSALSAVRRMHSDVSKMLVDADSTIGKGLNPLFNGYATTNLTYSYRADCWMSGLVFRLFTDTDRPGIVKGITVWFFDNANKMTEPHLLAGELAYDLTPDQKIEKVCLGDDQITAYSKWHGNPVPDTVLTGRNPKPSVRSYKVIATPLYSIASMADEVELMDRVQLADFPKDRES